MTTTETTTPAERAKQISDRLHEIAPWPDRDPTPEAVARWLAVHAQREWTAHIIPFTEPGGPDTLDVNAVAKLNAQFAAAHALLALIGTGREAKVAREIALAWSGGSAAGIWTWEHLRDLGVDPEEVTRLEQARMALDKAASDEKADELTRLRNGGRELGRITARLYRSMRAASIEMAQNGPEAGMQWVLNSIPPPVDEGDGELWDGTETAQEWFDRVEAADRAAEAEATR